MVNFCVHELIYGLIIMTGSLNFGYSVEITSPLVPFFKTEWGISTMNTTWFNAILALFAVIGPFITTWMLNFLSRRLVFCILQVTTSVLYLIMLAASKKAFAVMTVMRALQGLVIGGVTSITPTMLVEAAPAGLTGFFGNLNRIGCVIGIIIMYLQGNWTVNTSKNATKWWSLEITCADINGVGAALIWICPETGKKAEEADNADSEQKKESVFQKQYLGKLLVGIAMMFIQQFSGVNAILTNLDENFKEVGAPLDSGIASTISVAAQLVAVFVSGFLVDWMGRRPLFCISCVGCGLMLIIFSLNYKFGWANWLSIVVIFVYMFFFGVALGPIPWFVVPELFPDSVRSMGASMISMGNQLFSFIVIFIFPWMKGDTDANGKVTSGIGLMWTCIVFAIVSILGAVFGFFFITEPNEKKDENLDWDDKKENNENKETNDVAV
ncbi:major facilitator superfamily protein [Trichomonas vaginalis G3]|uniref:Major facilitator superfamily protein n=1 Tax=Trichomonas vaginalis (strain ATCC PRA-98 / G3) TaxID=412133 RepID=A2DK85_TRIV3|nr:major facilitator superfamily transporter [Trichomonas vaginalis G3]EAY19256.1 major facilitator superfamily protein [Trichomonas vaginalis G3]KAI5548564.1 glucose import [Trichomonas vaginalis G3]|eukprot:XP_001580242.1 major facilitator superfamily transporter [Trichomonas vaginalis G3]